MGVPLSIVSRIARNLKKKSSKKETINLQLRENKSRCYLQRSNKTRKLMVLKGQSVIEVGIHTGR